MVNYGVSRGCEECKRRRKKCDETRPTCRRCTKTGKSCPGYKDEASLVFRHWSKRQARHPLPTSWWSSETDDEALEESSLRIFTAHFVGEPVDRQSSRGFLNGIQFLLDKPDPRCLLACSAKILVLGTLGNRLGRKSLTIMANQNYGNLLRAFHQSLSGDDKCVSVEHLCTAILLGLYEISVSHDTSPMQYIAHARGVCAILSNSAFPFQLAAGCMLSSPLHLCNTLQNEVVQYSPINDVKVRSLDSTLSKFQDFHQRAELYLIQPLPTVENLLQLQEEASAINREFAQWRESVDINDPVYSWSTVASLDKSMVELSGCPYSHSGPVDEYFDYFIASVWNTYRKARIMLLDTMTYLARHMSQDEAVLQLEKQAEKIVKEITASIPYHLADNIDNYLRCVQARTSPMPSNRVFGGFLLLYPLFESSKCKIVSHESRLYFIRCLLWIGEQMGIGQASLLANCVNRRMSEPHPLHDPEFPYQYVFEGNLLIQASMTLEPKYANLPTKKHTIASS